MPLASLHARSFTRTGEEVIGEEAIGEEVIGEEGGDR